MRNVLRVIIVGAVFALIPSPGNAEPPGVTLKLKLKTTSTNVEGYVLFVGVLSGQNGAIVKLTTGEIVRALVPVGRVVFPGQVATLSRLEHEETKQALYMVTESRDRMTANNTSERTSWQASPSARPPAAQLGR